MIFRIWHGWTTPSDADKYQQLVDTVIVPGIIAQDIPGLQRVRILRRASEQSSEVEFVTIMEFADWAAVQEFAGPDGTTSVVPDTARMVLKRFDEHSQHYELVSTHTATRSDL